MLEYESMIKKGRPYTSKPIEYKSMFQHMNDEFSGSAYKMESHNKSYQETNEAFARIVMKNKF
jgi:hypothetical protein